MRPASTHLEVQARPSVRARYRRVDEWLGEQAHALLFASRLGRVQFYCRNVAVFLLIALALYRLFPRFLMQNLDGVNLYFVLDKLSIWRSSPWQTTTVTPLESMTSALWFPLNPLFIPPFWSFALTNDPTPRLYLLTLCASLSIFAASLLFYRALGFARIFAVCAAWLSFALVMLQDTNLLQGINNVQVMAWAYVCLALLAWIGRLDVWRGTLALVLFQAAFLAYVLGDPVWHLITLPVFGLLALAILTGSDSRRELILKVASLAIAFGVQAVLRTYESLFYTLADTTRSVLPSEYARIAREPSSAGLLFRGDTIELACAGLLIVGLAIGRLDLLSARPRQARLLSRASIAFYGLVTVAGLLYLYSTRVPAFRTGYFVEMSYPIAALFMAGAIWRLYCLVRPSASGAWAMRIAGDWKPFAIAAGALAVFGAWHILNSRVTGGRMSDVLVAAAAALLLIGVGWVRTAAALLVALALVVLQQHIDSSYGPHGGNVVADAPTRMQLHGNELVRQLASELAIQPGGTFRGYVEDAYQRALRVPSVGDQLVWHWNYNWDHYDNGQTLFSWSLFNIPTISEYDPFVKPLYYVFFTRLLNNYGDQQLDNYLGATRINERIMALMGVRYVVTDRSDTQGLTDTRPTGPLRVLRVSDPNLGSYSPTRVTHAGTARDVLSALERDGFDPRQQVVVTDASALPALVPAAPGELRFDRGGFRVTATSPGWSMLVLPIQFSHCYALDADTTPADAQLLRVNLAQTGLVFHGDLTATVDFRHWPLASPGCQAQDYADTPDAAGVGAGALIGPCREAALPDDEDGERDQQGDGRHVPPGPPEEGTIDQIDVASAGRDGDAAHGDVGWPYWHRLTVDGGAPAAVPHLVHHQKAWSIGGGKVVAQVVSAA